MMGRLLRNYLSSGFDHGDDGLLRLKFSIVNSFTLIGVSFVFILGTMNIARNNFILGGLEITGGVLCLINVLLLRRTRNIEFAGTVILFLMLCLFVSLFVFGSDDRTSLFWFFTYPPLALFLKDRRRGFPWIVMQFLVIIVMTVMSETRLLFVIPYTRYEMVLLCLSLSALTLIVLFYGMMSDHYAALQEKRRRELLRKKEFDDQFAIAERIQRLLIPREDRVFGRLSVSGFYQAAAGVGGDYYDFIEIDQGRVAVIICDVSGKSVAGAFVMVNIRSIFQHSIPRSDMNPAAIVKIINRRLLADATNDIFAVLSVYIFNSGSRQVDFCNAGYGPFAYYRHRERAVIEVPSDSLPVGVVEDDTNYVNTTIKLDPGDIIISYTDGILESFQKASEKNDKEALYRLVRKRAYEHPSNIKQAILDEIGEIYREQHRQDDLSLVISKIY